MFESRNGLPFVLNRLKIQYERSKNNNKKKNVVYFFIRR